MACNDAKRLAPDDSFEESSLRDMIKQLHEESMRKNELMLSDLRVSIVNEMKDSLAEVKAAVDGIKSRVDKHEADISDLKESISFTADANKDNEAKVAQAERRVAELGIEVDSVKAKLTKAESAIIASDTTARRNNLLFFGIAESPVGQSEDCSQLIKDLVKCIDGLKEKRVSRSLQLAHRVGARPTEQDARPRPIKVCFSDLSIRDDIQKGRRKLPKEIAVRDDLPLSVRKARESLYAEADRLRQNKDNKVSIALPAKLLLNGKVHKVAHPVNF